MRCAMEGGGAEALPQAGDRSTSTTTRNKAAIASDCPKPRDRSEPEETTMAFRARQLTTCAAVAVAAMLAAAPARAVDPSRILSAEQNPADWLTYHGGYKSYHYSALDQINAGNVKNLQVAWIHLPGKSTR